MTYDWIKTRQVLKGNVVQYEAEVLVPADPSKTDFHSEMDRAVIHLANSTNKPIFLGLSGGLDSEYLANVFVRNKIDFTPICLNFDGYNNAELWYAERWCKKNNKNLIMLDVSIDKFLEYSKKSQAEHLTKNMGCYMLLMLADYVSKKYNGVFISGDGDPGDLHSRPKSKPDGATELVDFYYWDVDFIFDHIRPGQHPRGMFSYFPETVYSYIYNYDDTVHEQEAKYTMFDIDPRPKIDVFVTVHPWRTYYYSEYNKLLNSKNFKLGNKKETLTWLTRRT